MLLNIAAIMVITVLSFYILSFIIKFILVYRMEKDKQRRKNQTLNDLYNNFKKK